MRTGDYEETIVTVTSTSSFTLKKVFYTVSFDSSVTGFGSAFTTIGSISSSEARVL